MTAAFINATQKVALDDVQGILGMAFDTTGSNIYQAMRTAWGAQAAEQLGHSFLNNLFEMNMSLPNNFDVQLTRAEQPGQPDVGE